jgi:hypothetical protein
MSNAPSTQPAPDEPPQFDIEAARARYRRLMRSWPMRMMYLLLILTILFSWAFALASAFASDVEHLPGHDITVPVRDCVWCHTEGAAVHSAPPMNHLSAPTCGFCHRQSLPDETKVGGWAIEPQP